MNTTQLIQRAEALISQGNPEEAGKLLQDDYQEKVAAAVADGVEEYIKNNEQ